LLLIFIKFARKASHGRAMVLNFISPSLNNINRAGDEWVSLPTLASVAAVQDVAAQRFSTGDCYADLTCEPAVALVRQR
jgi:hypothetical protein